MAQIIRHKKGVLESVKDATFKRKAEILVSTGSAVAGLDSSVVFIGRDGSRLDAVGRIYTGSSTPDIANNSSLDTSVDGIPFYNTTSEKLFILKKSGNIEVKAVANTSGTGIISGSSQIAALGAGIVSSSAQTISHLLGSNIYSSSAQVAADLTSDNRNIDLGSGTFTTSTSGSFGHIAVTGNATIDGNLILGGNITIGDASSDSISFGGQVSSDIIPDPTQTYSLGSASNKFLGVHASTLYGSISATNGVVSGSAQTIAHLGGSGIVSESAQTIAHLGGSGIVSESAQTIAHLNGSGVISGSAQLLNVATDFGTGRVSGDNFGDVAGTSTFTGSFVGDGSLLTGLVTDLRISGSTGNDVVSLLSDDLSIVGTANEITTTVTNNQIQIGLVENPTLTGNVTVTGNFQVQGTTTTVDSTTVSIGDNIIELNGTGAVNAGLLVKDVTAPNQVSGSLLWDGTNDYWKGGALGSEVRFLRATGDAIVSSSAQVSAYGVFAELNGDNLVSSSAQISGYNTFLEINGDNVVSSSAQVSAYGVFAELNGDNLVSSSAQVSAYNTFLEINGDGVHSGSAQVVAALVDQDVDFGTGGISGSSLDITGNAKIDGNIVIGGNITIGDASSDTISFGGEISSDIIPSNTNQYNLGSSTDKFAEVHATTIYGSISATNGVVSGSAQTIAHLGGSGVISGSTQLDGTTLGSTSGIVASGSFSGSFFGDGSGITGLSTTLSVSGSDGSNDQVSLLDGALSFAGGTGVSATVATDTVTISVQDASTSVKGIASFDSDDFSVSTGVVSIKNGGVRAINLNADVVGDGLELDGTNNDINVLYGSAENNAVEGNTTITVNGTANEIEISGVAAQALGGGASYTIGLPNDVTIGNDLTVTTDASVGGNLTVTGNLSVLGTTTTIDSTTVSIGDNIIELNYGGAQTTAGLQVTDSTGGSTTSGSLLWNGATDKWTGGALGSEKEFARLNSSPSTNTVLKADSNGLLVNSTITDDGTDVSLTGDLTITGLNAGANGAFIYVDSNDKLQSVNASTAGDVIQWDGSSFVASNEIDGGAF